MNFSSSRDDYKFLQIVDARAALNQKVNLIGVVVETGLPKQSKGTDCFCSVRVIDESYPNPGISINFFAETMDKLPQVLTVGDIIQLSQVVMKTHGPDIYALFNKKFSSFAIFDGKISSNFIPYQCSPKYQAREQDKKFILGLMKWLVDHKIDTGLVDLHSLSEIREGERFNLICKIVHVCEVAKDKSMLLVWDGMDTPPVTIKTKRVISTFLSGIELEPRVLETTSLPLKVGARSVTPLVGFTLCCCNQALDKEYTRDLV